MLAVLATLISAHPAAAQQNTTREIQESQRRLEQIRRERAQLRAEMERIRSRVHDISTELRLLDRQVQTSANAVAELEFQVAQHEAQIAETTRDLSSTRDHLADRKSILNRRLRDIYKRGPLPAAEVLLRAESFGELISRYRYLFLIARHDRYLVRNVAALESGLVARERLLQRSLMQLQTLQDERASEYEQLAGLQAEQKRALSGVRVQQRVTSDRIARLERDEKRLATLVATLERKRKEAERRSARADAARSGTAAGRRPSEANTLTAADRGSLGWPVQGRLLYRFGRDKQRDGTVLRWNGIGIAAPAGTSVRAVESGTVVMSGPFEGYGPTVVLSHGGGYYSLYLYLREASVREGARIERGQVIGSVGGERTQEGAHIEFQIRAPGGQAIDPLDWLRKNRGAP